MNIKEFWSHVEKRDPNQCWEWKAGKNENGYGVVNLDTGKQEKAHRVAYMLQYEHPKEMFVLHKCDNPPCCNPNHLFLGTQKDNIQDMIKKGRRGKSGLQPGMWTGDKSPHHKLTEKKVSLIKSLLASGGRVSAVAKLFRVNHSLISQIKSNKIWKEVK